MKNTAVGVPTASTGRFLVMATTALGTASFSYQVILTNSGVPPVLTGPVGMALLVTATVLVYLAQPAWRRSRYVAPDLSDPHHRRVVTRVQELSEQCGLAAGPKVVFGQGGFAQAVGRHLRYSIVISGKLDPDDAGFFDGVVRHELTHIRLHDVDVSRLTIGLLCSFFPVVVMPYALIVGSDDIGRFLREDLWRLLALNALVFAMLCSVHRARELQADAHAALPEAAFRGTSKGFSWSDARSWFHPSRDQRVKAMTRPDIPISPNPWLGAATGVAAGIAILPIDRLIGLMTAGHANTVVGAAAEGLVAGLVIGSVIGPAMWQLAAHGDSAQAGHWSEGAVIAGGVLIGSQLSVQSPLTLSTLFGDRLWVAEIGFVALLAGLQALLCRWLTATAATWQIGMREQGCQRPSPGSRVIGPSFRSRLHLLGALLTAVLPTAAVWAFFLWSYRICTGFPYFFDQVMSGLLGRQASSPPSLLDQFTLFGVAVYDALMNQSAVLCPIYLAGVACVCAPLALAPLRDTAAWRRAAAVVGVGAVMFLTTLPFLGRLLADALSRDAREGTGLADLQQSFLVLVDLPVVIIGMWVAVTTGTLEARRGRHRPTLHAVGAAVVWGVIATAVTAAVHWRSPTSMFTSRVATTAVIITPLLSIAVTWPLSRILHRPAVDDRHPSVPARTPWLLITGTGTAGVLAIIMSFLVAPRLVSVAPPPSADEQTAQCVTGRWRVLEDMQTISVMGQRAPAAGGEGMTWTFMPDGRYRFETHSAEFLVTWRSRGWRMVFAGASEGAWRIEDGRLVLVDVTWTNEVHTLYFAPNEPMGKPLYIATGSQPETLVAKCASPLMTLQLGGRTEALSKVSAGSRSSGG